MSNVKQAKFVEITDVIVVWLIKNVGREKFAIKERVRAEIT